MDDPGHISIVGFGLWEGSTHRGQQLNLERFQKEREDNVIRMQAGHASILATSILVRFGCFSTLAISTAINYQAKLHKQI